MALQPGPLGMTRLEVLDKCCGEAGDPDFMLWLCRRLPCLAPSSSNKINEAGSFWGRAHKARQRFQSEALGLQALKGFANARKGEHLHHCLSTSWAKGLECALPTKKQRALQALTKHFQGDSSAMPLLEQLHDERLCAGALSEARVAALREVERLLT